MKTITKRKTSKVKKETASNISITLNIGGQIYVGEGETAIDALQAVPKPVKIMAKGVFTVSDGVKKKEVLMLPFRLRRLFYNKLYQVIQLKSLCMGMK